MNDYSSGSSPWYQSRTKVKSIIVESGITNIGKFAFSYHQSLEDVVMADSVTTINANAFFNCQGLKSVKLSANLLEIGDSAFSNCRTLPEINFPNSLEKIGAHGFSSCKTLKDPVFDKNLKSLGEYAFWCCDSIESVTIPASLTDIAYYVFDSCENLKTVNFAEGAHTMNGYMFRGCSSLEEIVLPDGLTSIPPYAFADCENLRWIWIPSSVTSIGASAFEAASGITRIAIPGSVKTIGSGAFYHCLNLRSAAYFGTEAAWNNVSIGGGNAPLTDLAIEFDPHTYVSFSKIDEGNCTSPKILQYTADNGMKRTEKIPALGHRYENEICIVCGSEYSASEALLDHGFCNADIEWKLKADGTMIISGKGNMPDYGVRTNAPWYDLRNSVKHVVIEDGITGIGAEAFTYHQSLEDVIMADSVTVINESAFDNCQNLKYVRLSSNLREICYSAFANCRTLPEITFPDSLEKIGAHGFSLCKSLKDPVFGENLKSLGEYAFWCCDGIEAVTIPAGLTDIAYYAFDSCKNLKTVNFAEGAHTMNGYMFRGCSALEEIVLPDGLTSIPPYAFADCTSLRWIWIPSSVTSIGPSAFEAASGITRIAIPGSVRTIGSGAFYHCLNLRSAVYFGTEAAWNNVSGKGALTDISSEYDVDIALEFDPHTYVSFSVKDKGSCTSPKVLSYKTADGAERIETIPASGHQYENDICSICGENYNAPEDLLAHGYCNSSIEWKLKKDGTLIISGNGNMPDYGVLTNVPWYDLRTSVKHLIIEDGITAIGSDAFCYHTQLEDVVVAGSVSAIGADAFLACYELNNILISSQSCVFKTSVFLGCPKTMTIWGIPGSDTEAYAVSNNLAFMDINDYESTEPEPTPDPEPVLLKITAQPSDQTVRNKQKAIFRVEASGEGLTYQWQLCTGSNKWNNISGASGKSYSVTASKKMNGYQYRCVITDSNGITITSDAASLNL